MKMRLTRTVALLLLTPWAIAQANPSPSPSSAPSSPTAPGTTAQRLDTLSQLLADTQRQLEQTQQQLNRLRSEVDRLRAIAPPPTETSPSGSPTPLSQQVARQQEQQEILQAEVKQHDQTKIETVSKYPLRVYGLLLANAYSNAGVVDNPDLPSVAILRTPNQSHGSIGAGFRQTLLGIAANGPHLVGAATSADLSVDFFGSPSYSFYNSTNGSLRLRRADLRLAWGRTGVGEDAHDDLHLGVDAPLISPLSPTSFATLAEAPLAWAGNLWTWAPQLRYKHVVPLSGASPNRTLQIEGGLWDPPVLGLNGPTASRKLSPGELARRPALLSRVSLHGGSAEQAAVFGIGGYADRQAFQAGQQIQMWAITADWQLPLSPLFLLTGEIYRGRGLGGLGGGAYKDTLTGIDTRTGLARTLGLNAAGGWTQLKTRFPRGAEANFIFGQDGAFARDFRPLDLSASTNPLDRSARTQAMVVNFIYRPKTYLILSPEYRRIASWQIVEPAATANIYTLSLGYRF